MATVAELYDIALNRDPPFAYPEADERTKEILVGRSAEEFRRQFQAIFTAAMQQPIMTAIIGKPGSGKTQFIHHFEWKANEVGEYHGAVVIFKPAGQPFTVDQLLQFMAQDENFQRKATAAGVPFDWFQGGTKDRMASAINQAIVRMRQYYKDNHVGIVLAVDNVDEHLRLLTANLDPGAAARTIQGFLGVLRLLLSELKGLCILLALTEDGYNGIAQVVAEDQTLNRRFLVAQGADGKPMTLGEFQEQEAYELVAAHLENWARRNNLTLPTAKGCQAGSRNLFPFTKEAVRLFWKAGGYPGYISQGCKMSLIHKALLTLPQTENDGLVKDEDALVILKTYGSIFPKIEALRRQLAALA